MLGESGTTHQLLVEFNKPCDYFNLHFITVEFGKHAKLIGLSKISLNRAYSTVLTGERMTYIL
jgi:hypothetical protein